MRIALAGHHETSTGTTSTAAAPVGGGRAECCLARLGRLRRRHAVGVARRGIHHRAVPTRVDSEPHAHDPLHLDALHLDAPLPDGDAR